MAKIVEIVTNDRAPIQSFTEAIGADPLFAARLLRLANFAPGTTQRVSTVAQAANVLGLDNLMSLALGLSVFALSNTPSPDDGLVVAPAITLRDLWDHALGCAAIAGRFATQVKSVSPLSAFAAGFVHDIGKVLLYRYSPEGLSQAADIAQAKNLPMTEAETLALGIDHVAIGEEWGKKSQLSLPLSHVLRFHHERFDRLPDSIDDDARRLIQTVQLADLTGEAQGIGKGGDSGAVPGELWRELRLKEEDWTDLLRAGKERVESVRETFGFQKFETKVPPVQRRPRDRPEGKPSRSSKTPANGPRGLVLQFPTRMENTAAEPEKPGSGKLSILVVEDHSSLCDLLSLYFMRQGYHVRTANDGGSALEVLSREDIHLVLLDLMLPRVDGFEVLRQIHRMNPQRMPYIIVVSAGASERDRRKVLELGANEYMPKPFHLLRLLERVQAVEKFLL
jgi:CheY-like chemotaxis protein/HD-like signal output (HDOD) protein